MRELHRTRQEAILAARQQAKQHEPSQVVVHGRDGRIRTEYAYGDDPGTSPAGTRQVDAMVLRPPLEPMLAQTREAVPAPGVLPAGRRSRRRSTVLQRPRTCPREAVRWPSRCDRTGGMQVGCRSSRRRRSRTGRCQRPWSTVALLDSAAAGPATGRCGRTRTPPSPRPGRLGNPDRSRLPGERRHRPGGGHDFTAERTKIYVGESRHWVVVWLWFLS